MSTNGVVKFHSSDRTVFTKPGGHLEVISHFPTLFHSKNSPHFSVYKNGVELDDVEGTWNCALRHHILKLSDMSLTDDGHYTVTGRGTDMRLVEDNFDVCIAEPPQFDRPLPEQQTITARWGGALNCHVTSSLPVTVRWYKDWRPLSDSNRLVMSHDGRGHCTLALGNAIVRDGGLYACVATSPVGKSVTQTTLLIQANTLNYLNDQDLRGQTSAVVS